MGTSASAPAHSVHLVLLSLELQSIIMITQAAGFWCGHGVQKPQATKIIIIFASRPLLPFHGFAQY